MDEGSLTMIDFINWLLREGVFVSDVPYFSLSASRCPLYKIGVLCCAFC